MLFEMILGDQGSPAPRATVLECEDGEGRLSWLTALTPERVEWISSIVGRGAGDGPVIDDEAESQWNLSSYLLLSSSWR